MQEKSTINFTNHHAPIYAEIIIPLALPKNYTWSIPDQFKENLQPGTRVEVVLGKNKKYAGIIKNIVHKNPVGFDPKPILNILDKEPIVQQQQLKLWEWIANYYMCSEGEVMQAAIPANLKLSSETVLIWNEEHTQDFSDLDDKEYLIAEALSLKKELKLSQVQQILDTTSVYLVIKKLIEKNICYAWENLQEKYKEKTETYLQLHPNYQQEEALATLLNSWSKAPKQLALLLSYLHLIKTQGEVIQTELLKKSNATLSQLKGLIDKGILLKDKRSRDRIKSLPKSIQIDFDLSPAQSTALHHIQSIFKTHQTCLLHGVTSSGKTQLYIKLIEELIQQDRQVLYMLPEIALTAQVIRRLQKHLGGHIAIYHSKFNANERVEIWNKVKSGETKVILGARSSLLLPFQNLGLIIVDEEHDTSYKQQDPAPRYHARDTAIYYASLFKANVLLGSATPSIETYFNCKQEKYGMVELTERFGNFKLPAIEIIDTKQYAFKNKLIVSPPLKEAIDQTLENTMQVILFQNRRGYSPYLICQVCGWIPQCKHCNVTLTYHKSKNKLTCHYCGTNYPALNTCIACGSQQFRQKNFGTEKVEELLAEDFSNARIARMDYDSVKGKHDHDTLIKLFEQKKIDILVGTQMVVKGLDFEHVDLVGILDADGILNFTDFRVNEHAFQLMEQVSGRAGRKNEKGSVMLQTSNPQHPVIQLVKSHDYKGLYDFEIENRKNFFYPPYSRIIQLVCKHKESHIAEEAANWLVEGLKKNHEQHISAPAEPLINRVRNQYLWKILIKLPKHAQLINRCKQEIHQQISLLQNNKRYRSVTIQSDVDPVQ